MRRRYLAQEQKPKGNYIKFTMNITTTTARTQVFSSNFAGSSQVDYICFNTYDHTTHYQYDTGFQFTTAGTRVGFIHFKPGVTNLSNLFENITCITELDFNNLDTRYVTTMTGMCMGCTALKTVKMDQCRANNLNQMINTFNSCTVLSSVDFGAWNRGKFRPTNKLTDMRNIFNYCRNLSFLDMSSFDLSGVTLYGYSWGNCPALVTLYINSTINQNATYSTSMFSGASASGAKLYYNKYYDISKMKAIMPSNWTTVAYTYAA